MTQAVVINKLIRYVKMQSPKNIADLEALKLQPDANIAKIDGLIAEHNLYVKEFEKVFREGNCHGLSICHATMEKTGKLDWWEHVLFEIANWDESSESLTKQIDIPGADEKITFQQLIERALNYIAYHHAVSFFSDFKPNGMNQDTILRPTANPEEHSPHFELLTEKDDKKTVETIQKFNLAAGYFTKKNLAKLLDEKYIRDNICLISSYDHSIRIGFDGKSWLIYDPNYSHVHLKAMHQSYHSKEEMIDELVHRLSTNALSIQIASFEKTEIQFPEYDRLIETAPETLLGHGGLHIIAKESPKIMLAICKAAGADTTQGKKLRFALSQALVTKSSDTLYMYSGLRAMLFAPEALNEICKLAVGNTKLAAMLRSSLLESLSTIDVKGDTILIELTEKHPQLFNTLMTLLQGPELDFHITLGLMDAFIMTKYHVNKLIGEFSKTELSPEQKIIFDAQLKQFKILDEKINNVINEKGADKLSIVNRYKGIYSEIDIIIKMLKLVKDNDIQTIKSHEDLITILTPLPINERMDYLERHDISKIEQIIINSRQLSHIMLLLPVNQKMAFVNRLSAETIGRIITDNIALFNLLRIATQENAISLVNAVGMPLIQRVIDDKHLGVIMMQLPKHYWPTFISGIGTLQINRMINTLDKLNALITDLSSEQILPFMHAVSPHLDWNVIFKDENDLYHFITNFKNTDQIAMIALPGIPPTVSNQIKLEQEIILILDQTQDMDIGIDRAKLSIEQANLTESLVDEIINLYNEMSKHSLLEGKTKLCESILEQTSARLSQLKDIKNNQTKEQFDMLQAKYNEIHDFIVNKLQIVNPEAAKKLIDELENLKQQCGDIAQFSNLEDKGPLFQAADALKASLAGARKQVLKESKAEMDHDRFNAVIKMLDEKIKHIPDSPEKVRIQRHFNRLEKNQTGFADMRQKKRQALMAIAKQLLSETVSATEKLVPAKTPSHKM